MDIDKVQFRDRELLQSNIFFCFQGGKNAVRPGVSKTPSIDFLNIVFPRERLIERPRPAR